jgi:capsule biosynthesis phosphatase
MSNLLSDSKKGTIIIDVDGTLCEKKKDHESYADVKPNLDLIRKIYEYKNLGYKILLFTSRNMKSFDSNIGLINKHTAPVLLAWLEKWSVPYDEILYGKPWPGDNGFYVDDRSVRPGEFTTLTENQIHNLLAKK